MKVLITPSGKIRAVYSDQIELRDLGPCEIRRAASVEPTSNGMWEILSPEGKFLFGNYWKREDALRMETEIVESDLCENYD